MKALGFCEMCFTEREAKVPAVDVYLGDPLCGFCLKKAQDAPKVTVDPALGAYVRVEDVPEAASHVRKATGRVGQLWAALENAPAAMPRLKIVCRDREHLSYTVRHLRKRAEVEGRVLASQAKGDQLWCWLETRR